MDNPNQVKRIHAIILWMLLLSLAFAGLIGEKIPVNNQTGWDGKYYSYLTIHFDSLFTTKQINSYQFQRILTPAIIHYGCKWVGIILTEHNVVSVYEWFNLIILLIGASVFLRTAMLIKLSVQQLIIGFACLFFNYSTLKLSPYNPVLTDTTVYVFGILLACAYATSSQWGLWLVSAFGIFCFPLFTLLSIPLLLNNKGNQLIKWLQQSELPRWLPFLVSIIWLSGIFFILVFPQYLNPRYELRRIAWVVPVSILAGVLYAYRAVKIWSSNLNLPQTPNVRLMVWPLLSILCLFGLAQVYIHYNSVPENAFTLSIFLTNVLQQSIDNPFVFIIAHTVYLGPAIFLMVLYYGKIVEKAKHWGHSATLYLLVFTLLSLGSETRQFMHCFPFLVLLLIQSINFNKLSVKRAWVFVLLCLIASKFWFTINTPEIYADYNYEDFPDQRYFMHQGPFMSDLSYLYNLATVAIIGVATCLWIKPINANGALNENQGN
ncbi:MAG: hypothetical protein MUE96_05070 [Bacteroidia bacterium]|jgi:hypothetical protein|nr:hypothetical protein [Bacteroidia bacterium]